MSTILIKNYRSFIPKGKKTFGDPDWKNFEDMLYYCLRELGYDFTIASELVKDMNDPTLIFCAHKTKLTEPNAHVFYKQMHLSYLFTIDTQGWGPQHSGVQTAPLYKTSDTKTAIDFCQDLSKDFLSNGTSKQKQPSVKAAIKTPDEYILVPLQRPTDDMLKQNSPISVYDFITVLSAWGKEKEINIVFKLHPSNFLDPEIITHVKECVGKSKYLHLVEGNIHTLITKSKGVFCINSGTGFESLIHGKPVVTFGNCDYKWVTFNANENLLNEAHQYANNYTKNQREIGYKLVYYYYHTHAYSIKEEDREDSINRLRVYLKNTIKMLKAPLSIINS